MKLYTHEVAYTRKLKGKLKTWDFQLIIRELSLLFVSPSSAVLVKLVYLQFRVFEHASFPIVFSLTSNIDQTKSLIERISRLLFPFTCESSNRGKRFSRAIKNTSKSFSFTRLESTFVYQALLHLSRVFLRGEEAGEIENNANFITIQFIVTSDSRWQNIIYIKEPLKSLPIPRYTVFYIFL